MITNLFENVVKQVLLEGCNNTNANSKVEFVGGNSSNGFYIYHCCAAHNKDNIAQAGARRIFTNKGAGNMYGDGIYSTYTIQSTINNADRNWYGQTMVKGICRENIKNFLIFDPNISKQVYGTPLNLMEQLQLLLKGKKDIYDIIIQQPDFNNIQQYFRQDAYTAEGARRFWHLISNVEYAHHINIRKYIKGLIFSGSNDGNVAIIYDFSAVEIIGYTHYHYGMSVDDFKNSFQTIDRSDWIHQELAHNYDLKHELGFEYNEYPTQGFTRGYAVVGKNGKYRILSQKLFERARKKGIESDGRISDLFFDDVFGLSFDADGYLKVQYNGTLYIIKHVGKEIYKVMDADEGVFVCNLKDLEKYDMNKNTVTKRKPTVDNTDWENMDLSGF